MHPQQHELSKVNKSIEPTKLKENVKLQTNFWSHFVLGCVNNEGDLRFYCFFTCTYNNFVQNNFFLNNTPIHNNNITINIIIKLWRLKAECWARDHLQGQQVECKTHTDN